MNAPAKWHVPCATRYAFRNLMLDLLLAQFDQHETLLVQAIDGDDQAAIDEIDRRLFKLWQQILNYEPVNEDEAGKLFAFLLDSILREAGASDGHMLRLREKVVLLYRNRH